MDKTEKKEPKTETLKLAEAEVPVTPAAPPPPRHVIIATDGVNANIHQNGMTAWEAYGILSQYLFRATPAAQAAPDKAG